MEKRKRDRAQGFLERSGVNMGFHKATAALMERACMVDGALLLLRLLLPQTPVPELPARAHGCRAWHGRREAGSWCWGLRDSVNLTATSDEGRDGYGNKYWGFGWRGVRRIAGVR
jgi:hypothetical protein